MLSEAHDAVIDVSVLNSLNRSNLRRWHPTKRSTTTYRTPNLCPLVR